MKPLGLVMLLSVVLLKLGIGLSVFLISIPAMFCSGYRVLEMAHILR